MENLYRRLWDSIQIKVRTLRLWLFFGRCGWWNNPPAQPQSFQEDTAVSQGSHRRGQCEYEDQDTWAVSEPPFRSCPGSDAKTHKWGGRIVSSSLGLYPKHGIWPEHVINDSTLWNTCCESFRHKNSSVVSPEKFIIYQIIC